MDELNSLAGMYAGSKDVPQGNSLVLARNMKYAMPAPVMQGGYLTKLSPLDEMAFKQWVAANNVPFDPSPEADYDMRGFFKALMTGDPRAKTGMNANDGQLHFTDFFKTPNHKSFSAESKYAKPNAGAPSWNESDQLVTPGGRIVFDERAEQRK